MHISKFFCLILDPQYHILGVCDAQPGVLVIVLNYEVL